jgi:hypothetical protein
MDSEDMLYLLYTSGSTGKPKGIIHTTGGYLTGVTATHRLIFDLREEDVFWCTADIGWVTGHSYIVYGPLANGTTTVMYEGTPDWPDKDRFWRIVEKYGITILYTAPTAIRTFVRWGEEYPKRCDLSSLRLLGTVGEPINPEAWVWYWKVIGGGRCPVVDTWWQTETGHILISPLPGTTVCKPGSATQPFPGIDAEVVNDKGESAHAGYLVIRRPWPGMLRGIYGDPERYHRQYWSQIPGVYFTGDGCKKDKDGYFWLLGRIDDVMNISGHRVSTMEVESALVDHPAVAEAAVIGRPHEIKGQAIAAFCTIKHGIPTSDALKEEIKQHVARKIGALARPDDVIYAAELPKTRSGKIMRRLLRDVAEGRPPPRAGAAPAATRPRWPIPRWSPRSRISTRSARARARNGHALGPRAASARRAAGRRAWKPHRARYRRPWASAALSGSRRSSAIASVPRKGPGARNAKAHGQPHASTARGTSQVAGRVSKKPRLVWSDSAVPTYGDGASSVTDAENWAESATMVKPQTRATRTSHPGLSKVSPMTAAHVPLVSIASIVTAVRPTRSAMKPARTQLAAPAPMTRAVAIAPRRGAADSPARVNASRR